LYYSFVFVYFFFSLSLLLPYSSTLFPYTTLFRSHIFNVFNNGFLIFDELFPFTFQCLEGLFWGLSVIKLYFREIIFCKFCLQVRSEEHTSELQSRFDIVCRLLLEKKKNIFIKYDI